MTEEQRGSPTEQLFKYAVERINRDPELLPNTTLIYDIHYVDREDSWHTSKKGTVCISVEFVFFKIPNAGEKTCCNESWYTFRSNSSLLVDENLLKFLLRTLSINTIQDLNNLFQLVYDLELGTSILDVGILLVCYTSTDFTIQIRSDELSTKGFAGVPRLCFSNEIWQYYFMVLTF